MRYRVGWIAGIAMFAGVSLAAGACSSDRASEAAAKPSSDGIVTITAVDMDFLEGDLVVAAGTVTFEMTNRGYAPHTFVIEGHEDDLKLSTSAHGSVDRGTIRLTPGDYVYYCDVPGHRAAGMWARLHVS